MAAPETVYSEPAYVQNKEKFQCPYWRASIADRIPPETHTLLEQYSNVPPAQHDDHVHQTRDRLWEIRQYPCTGGGGWLKPQLCLSTVYPEVLDRAKAGETVVDMGTFIGHDLRRLVVDGAPSDQLWGLDIANHFDIGFDFFKDRQSWKGTFVEADFLAVETASSLQPLRAQTDVIWVASVLHQWDWAGQVRGASALAHFTKPGAGSLIAGLQMGKDDAGDVVMQGLKVPLYIHNAETWSKLWQEVGEATGTRWSTSYLPHPWEWIGIDTAEMAWMGPGVRLFEFAVRREA